MTLLDLHQWWAWPVVVGNGVVGLWALAAHRWPEARKRALWWCTAAAEVAIAVQVVLGVAAQSSTWKAGLHVVPSGITTCGPPSFSGATCWPCQ